ncbi:hypothetical protein FQA39_LY04200 [Lamprigera yunnana]|nr:hypothetical protein FQA39_LY04200 [Lamprigera yunnana]
MYSYKINDLNFHKFLELRRKGSLVLSFTLTAPNLVSLDVLRGLHTNSLSDKYDKKEIKFYNFRSWCVLTDDNGNAYIEEDFNLEGYDSDGVTPYEAVDSFNEDSEEETPCSRKRRRNIQQKRQNVPDLLNDSITRENDNNEGGAPQAKKLLNHMPENYEQKEH